MFKTLAGQRLRCVEDALSLSRSRYQEARQARVACIRELAGKQQPPRAQLFRRPVQRAQSLRRALSDRSAKCPKELWTALARRLLRRFGMDHHPASSHIHDSPDLGQLLSQDHTRLDRLFQDLLNAFEADARTEVARLWNEFDNDLRAHLQLEEEHLLPKFLEFNAPEALALMREHQSIRDRLLQLGVGVDLHLTRHGQVADFVRELRAHAQREDDLMYRWSTQHVRDSELHHSVVQRLARPR